MGLKVGDIGRAVTPLNPSGMIEVNGAAFPARCETYAIPVDAEVEVVRGDRQGVIVRSLGRRTEMLDANWDESANEDTRRTPGWLLALGAIAHGFFTSHEAAMALVWFVVIGLGAGLGSGIGFLLWAKSGAVIGAISGSILFPAATALVFSIGPTS